jgi:DNA-binding transcriptional regulator YhcF (GntR family)
MTAQLDATTRLRKLILNGTFQPGDTLPPERELEVRLKVSRSTLRGAVASLVSEGLLRVMHGSGTRVRSWLSEGTFDLVGSLLLLTDNSDFIKQLLWLRRTLYTSLVEHWTKPRPDFREAVGAQLDVWDSGRHDGTQVIAMLDAEERLLCTLASDTNVPAAMLGHGIRRALHRVLQGVEDDLPPALPRAREQVDALVKAYMEGRKSVRLVEELVELREKVYLDAAAHSAKAHKGK